MIDQSKLKIFKDLINKHNNIYLFHHVNPDGDCTASSFGLAETLRETYPNKKIKVVASKEYSSKMEYLYPWLDWNNTVTQPEEENYLAIIGDTSVENRVMHLENFDSTRNDTICFDHHENDLDFDVNVFWQERKYPAAAIMVEELVRELELKLNERSALLINHGIVTDTGSFKFNYANPFAQLASANLLKYISQNEQIAITKALFSKTKKDIAFDSWVMSTFKIKNKIAYHAITQDDLDKFEIDSDSAARPHLIGDIEGIDVWVLFTQYPNFVRVEFRSNVFAVDKIASHFGGGGHEWASGCKIDSMNEVSKVIEYLNIKIKN